MKIKVAQHIGFCFGVHRAIDMAEAALAQNEGRPVYTFGELIHNKSVVDELKQRGILAVGDLNRLRKNDVCIIRSHGVPPDVYDKAKSMGISLIDATCPFVARIHRIVEKYADMGHPIVIIGKADHPEVIGINGWCANKALIIESPEDTQKIDSVPNSACIVSQTTFSKDAFIEITDKIKRQNKDVFFFNTICETTLARQTEAEKLSRICTKMIIIGDKKSSNSRKLFEICKKHCEDTQTIENTDELSLEIIASNDIIGLVAGASTPARIIREVMSIMSELEKNINENSEAEACTTEEVTAAEEKITAEELSDVPSEAPSEVTAEQPAESSFEEAFEKTLVRIKNGQILKGSVVQIVDGEVCVNIGYKSDGFIPRNEFSSDPSVDPAEAVKVGDEIEVEVLKVNDGDGNVLLSRKNVEGKMAWEKIAKEMEDENRIFEGIGKEVVKGGLIASIEGVRAFIPASLLSTKYVENISDFVGQPLKLKVIEVDKARKRIVASQKAVLLEEAEAQKKEKWEHLVVGSKVTGVVRRLADFGAFVDIGGVNGLIHVTDMAWGRVKQPSDILKVGQEIEVLILNVDAQKERISLGYKQLQPKPWTLSEQKYPVGSIVEGKVVRIVPFGAFVALEPTIDGLIHISQVGARRVAKVEDELTVGDIVRCKVLEVNAEAKRISLSRREVLLEEDPELAEKIANEKADRERLAAERAEQRAAAAEQTKQKQQQQQEHQSRAASSEHRERSGGEHYERRQHSKEDGDYELPPVQQATTSLADLFSNFTPDKNE